MSGRLASHVRFGNAAKRPDNSHHIGLRRSRYHGCAAGKSQGRFCDWHGIRKNEGYVKALGADQFVDYTKGPFEQVIKHVDVVFDNVGGDTFERAIACLKPGGFLVTSVAFPSAEKMQGHGIRYGRVSLSAEFSTTHGDQPSGGI